MINMFLGLLMVLGNTMGIVQWSGQDWCPDRYGVYQCNEVQALAQPDSTYWSPNQVSVDQAGNVSFTMTYSPAVVNGYPRLYASGAINDAGISYWGMGTYTWAADVSCADGRVANWPVLAMNGYSKWPSGGEIDFFEGLGGEPTWHYHWARADGSEGSIGGAVHGDWCGHHTFSVNRRQDVITWYWDGTQVGQVTPAMTGMPLPSDPMYALADLNGQTWWNGFDPSKGFTVESFQVETRGESK